MVLAFAYTAQEQQKTANRNHAVELPQPAPGSKQSLASVLTQIAASVKNLTGASGAAIALGKGGEMICVARSGESAPAPGAQLNSREGLSGECIRTGEARLCVNVETDSRVDAASSHALGIGSMIYLPLHWKEKLIGILGVFSERPYCFQHKDLRSLRFSETLIIEALRHTKEPTINLRTLAGAASNAGDNVLEFPKATAHLEPLVPIENTPVNQPVGVFVNRPVAGVEAQGETPLEMLARVEFDPAPVQQEASQVAGICEAEPATWSQYHATEEEDSIHNEVLKWGEDISCVVRHAAPIGQENIPWDFNPGPLPQRNPAIVRLLLIGLVVAAVGGALWLESGRSSVNKTQVLPAVDPGMVPATVQPSSALRVPKSLGLTKDINYWAANGYTRVTVILRKPVKYESARLHDPERIYVDLPGVDLSENQERSFAVDDDVLRGVRVAKYQHDVTRIVFDLKVQGTFVASTAEGPNRLILEFFSRESKTDNKSGATSSTAKTVSLASPLGSHPGLLKIVIDPGHGGNDGGTIGQHGLLEKQLTLDVAKRLANRLEQDLGAQIIFTRDSDKYVSLASRAEIANRSRADLLVSIHANGSVDNGIRGVETFYFNNSNQALAESAVKKPTSPRRGSLEAKLLAADLQKSLLSGIEGGARDRGVKSASFVVLKEAQMPAVLAEISFVTSTKDEQDLKSDAYRDKIAKALYVGIASHVERKQRHPRLAAVIAESRPGIR